mgnify:CR=1 FL=1
MINGDVIAKNEMTVKDDVFNSIVNGIKTPIEKDVDIQKAQYGDILAVCVTGAYNYSMASNYNRIPRPPVVMVKDGEARVVVKRETYEQITANDI